MPADLTTFAGVLPYASQLFGVYQPLLGWRSRLGKERLDAERRATTHVFVANLLADPQALRAAAIAKGPVGPDDYVPFREPSFGSTAYTARLSEAVSQFASKQGRLPAGEEWKGLVTGIKLPDTPNGAVDKAAPVGVAAGKETDEGGEVQQGPAAEHLSAGAYKYLSEHAPSVLEASFWSLRSVANLKAYLDPAAAFGSHLAQAVLAPVGIVQLYRQFFFELESFLGPAVGHVWVSAGGTTELYEVHSRRRIEERAVEIGRETTRRTELETVDQDELSTAVGEQNAQNLSLGVSASGGANFGVWQASASATLGLQISNQRSAEEAHKQMRRQTQRIAEETRANLKTTFRTTVEDTDTSTRRHLIENKTDRLLNYELRRKMRKVGVQVQHVGTQLCWQLYVDDPGAGDDASPGLGLGLLVHVAQPNDDSGAPPPPEAPPRPDWKGTDVTVDFPFQPTAGNDAGVTYESGVAANPSPWVPRRIVFSREFAAVPPAAGYRLAAVAQTEVIRVNPERDRPDVAADFRVLAPAAYEVRLVRVNFHDQTTIRFALKLTWEPDPAFVASLEAEYQRRVATYTVQRQQAAHAEYVNAVRERVRLSGGVRARRAEDLRGEERSLIFRRLIGRLTHVALNASTHVTAELIRTLFELDKMLYFVAEEWWRPRPRSEQQVAPAAGRLAPGDQIGWGGVRDHSRANYLITEDAEPARMGASLGWLLQLDGDAHRNAFLNTPWVKVVVPIRAGKEREALDWLKREHVEGADGLDAPYRGPEPEFKDRTLEQVIGLLADQVAAAGTDMRNTLATERVFEEGFDPLEGGFRATGAPFEVFDQWVEVMPTDQIVATEYHTGG